MTERRGRSMEILVGVLVKLCGRSFSGESIHICALHYILLLGLYSVDMYHNIAKHSSG